MQTDTTLKGARVGPRAGQAKCKEHEGDAADLRTDAGRARAAELYTEAKKRYRTSHRTHPDAAAQQGFSRVQMKAHPDVEYVQAGPGGGGYARMLRDGVQLEAI